MARRPSGGPVEAECLLFRDPASGGRLAGNSAARARWSKSMVQGRVVFKRSADQARRCVAGQGIAQSVAFGLEPLLASKAWFSCCRIGRGTLPRSPAIIPRVSTPPPRCVPFWTLLESVPGRRRHDRGPWRLPLSAKPGRPAPPWVRIGHLLNRLQDGAVVGRIGHFHSDRAMRPLRRAIAPYSSINSTSFDVFWVVRKGDFQVICCLRFRSMSARLCSPESGRR